jgi:hypothetical protein
LQTHHLPVTDDVRPWIGIGGDFVVIGDGLPLAEMEEKHATVRFEQE